MLNKIRKYLVFSICAVLLYGCGGGACSTNNGGGSAVDLSKLLMSAPSQYPAGLAVTVPVVVTNSSTLALNNLEYSIIDNTTKADLVIVPSSATACRNLAVAQSCTLQVQIPSNSVAGAFSVGVSANNQVGIGGNSATFLSSLSSKLGLNSTFIEQVRVNIGLTTVVADAESGLNGVDFFYNSTVSLPDNSAGVVIVTMVVTSANVGAFNTLDLVDNNGNPVTYSVLTANSGNNFPTLGQGSVVSLAVNIPAGANQVSFYPSLKMNGTAIANGTSSTPISINVLRPSSTKQANITMYPGNFALNESNPSQYITVTNNGNDTATNFAPSVNAPMSIDPSGTTCGSSLAAGSSCTYKLTYNVNSTAAGTTFFGINYNNGLTSTSSTSHFTFKGKNAVAVLFINGNSNPNFDFHSTTNNPTDSTIVTLLNSGITTLTLESYTPPTYFSVESGGSNPCTVNQQLAVSDSCTVVLKYTNATVTPTQDTNTQFITYTYQDVIDPNITVTGSSGVGLTYWTDQSQASLSANIPQPFNLGTVVNNGVQYIEQLITIRNQGDDATTGVPVVSLTNSSSGYQIAQNTCTSALAAGASCAILVKFGPIESSAPAGNVENVISIGYVPYTGAANSTLNINTRAQVATAQSAILSTSLTSVSGPIVAGNGNESNPYIMQAGNAAVLTYTITNTGAVPANSLIVQHASGQNTDSCSNNTLQPSQSCTITYTVSPSVGVYQLALNGLTMTWTDQDSPSGQTQSFGANDVYLSGYTPAAINASISPSTIIPGATSNVTFNLTGGYNVPNQTLNINGSTPSDGNLTYSNAGVCTVGGSNPNTCTIGVTAVSSSIEESYVLSLSNAGNVQLSPTTLPLDVAFVPYKFYGAKGITLDPSGKYAYITNYDNKTVVSCSIESSTGHLIGCQDSEAYSGAYSLNGPMGISINPTRIQFAYITDYSGGNVVKCTIINGNKLSACGNSGAYPIGTNPTNTIFNITGLPGRFAYVTNSGESTVSLCPFSNPATGALSNACVDSGATGITSPFGIAFTSANYAFIANLDGNGGNGSIQQCSVNSVNGSLSGCADTGVTGLSGPQGITISPDGSHAFIADTSSVMQCSISGGTLSGCGDSGAIIAGTTKSVFAIAMTPNNGTYAYITNYKGDPQSGGTVTKCSVSGGTMSNCVQTGFQ